MEGLPGVVSQYSRSLTYIAVWAGLVVLAWADRGEVWARATFVTGIVLGLEVTLFSSVDAIRKRSGHSGAISATDLFKVVGSLVGLAVSWFLLPGSRAILFELAICIAIFYLIGDTIGRFGQKR